MCGWKCSRGRAGRGVESNPIPRPARPRLRVALAVLVFGFLAGCARLPEPPDSILRLSQRNEPAVLDPALATLPDEFFVLRALLDGLVAPNPEGGEPLPAAAERWTISPDGLTYTFHLRHGARWSNGEPVTAGDFVASYQRALSPATAAPKVALFFLVDGAQEFYRGERTSFDQTGFSAPDDYTVVIRLRRPAPQFLAYVASGPWLPVNPRVVARHGANWTRPEHFVGNGPFTLHAWRPNQRITLQHRADHPDAARVHVEEIQFVAMDNGETEERAFRAGQIDVTMAVPPTKLAAYETAQPAVLQRAPLHETRYLSFNTTRGPLADARVRRALSLAIDREAIVQHVIHGGQRAARGVVPPGLGGYTSTLGGSAFSPEAARRLLDEAGFPGGQGFPRLELITWTNLPVVETVQAMWQKELGIEIGLRQHEARVHLSTLADGNYDIAFMTMIPDVADAADLLSNLGTGAVANYPRWSEPRYDAALAAAAGATTAADRLRALAEAEAIAISASPVAPLYFNTRNFLVSPRVSGWQEDALWNRYYLDVKVGTD